MLEKMLRDREMPESELQGFGHGWLLGFYLPFRRLFSLASSNSGPIVEVGPLSLDMGMHGEMRSMIAVSRLYLRT